ncbi:MAG: eCIS core domain-containing protein [Alphaproteobacteria bacterium]
MSAKEAVQPVSDIRSEKSTFSCNSIVSDTNSERAKQTEDLVRDIAPQLGLRVSDMKIFSDEQAERVVGVHGFRGLMRDGSVYLDPKRYQASSTAGRALLAHEMVHVAQRTEWRGLQAGRGASVYEAEKEADALAQRYAAGHRMRAPVHALPEGHSAAFEGASAFDSLGVVPVDDIFKSELARIKAILEQEDIGSDEVEDVLRILDNVTLPDALSIMHNVWCVPLIRSLESEHVERWRGQVIACYASLDWLDIFTTDHAFFDGMDLRSLNAHERVMVQKVLANLRLSQLQEVLDDENNGPVVRALISAPLDIGATVHTFNQEIEQRHTAIREDFGVTLPEEARQPASFVQNILELANEGKFPEILSLFNVYTEQLNLSVSDVRRRDQDEAQRRLDHVSGEILLAERDALEAEQRATEESARLAEEEEEAQRRARTQLRRQEVVLRSVVQQLDDEGVVQRIIDFALEQNIYNADTKPQGFSADGFLSLLRYRAPDRNITLLERLLYRGIDDWAVRDYEARFAYDVLSQMAPDAQERFKRIRGGQLYNRLISNLPHSYLLRDDALFIGQEGVQAILSEEPYQFVSQVFEQIVTFFEDNCFLNKREAVAGFYAIVQLTPPVLGEKNRADQEESALDQAQKDIFRPVLVHRLDALGQIERMLNSLPESFLYSEGNWRGLSKIISALDPRSAQNLARNYLGKGWFDWMVTDREAFLGYRLYRMLSPEDQREINARFDNDIFGHITSEMSGDMRSHITLNPYRGADDPYARIPVLEELADSSFWQDEERATPEAVDVRVGLAVSMGYHREVFDLSKRMEVYLIPELMPVVNRYRLFVPRVRPEYVSLEVEGRPWYDEGVLQTLRDAGGYVVALVATLVQAGYGSSITVRGNAEQLEALLGEGLHFSTVGASVSNEEVPDGVGTTSTPSAQNPGVQQLTNEEVEAVGALLGDNDFELILDMDRDKVIGQIGSMDLSDIYVFVGDSKITIGQVSLSDLRFNAIFSVGEAFNLNSADLDLASLILSRIFFTTADTAVGVGHLGINPFSLHIGANSASDAYQTQSQPLFNITDPNSNWLKIPILSGLIFGILDPLISTVIHLLPYVLPTWLTGEDVMGGRSDDSYFMPYGSVEFGSFDVQNIVTSDGYALDSLHAERGIFAGGGNKPTYLRARMSAIQHRIDRLEAQGGAADEIRQLQDQSNTLQEELDTLRPQELELYRLQTRYEDDPGAFSDLDYTRLRELERQLAHRGGIAVDVQSLGIYGIDGPVRAGDIIIDDIHGYGSSSSMGSIASSYGRLAEEFVQNGYSSPQNSSTSQQISDAGIGLHLGTVTINDAVMEGGIPTVYALEQELQQLPARPRYDTRRRTIEGLLSKVRRYEVLEVRRRELARNGRPYLEEVEQEEYNGLRVELAQEFGAYVSTIRIEDANIGLGEGQEGVRLRSSKVTLSGVETHYGDFEGDIVLDNFDGTFRVDDNGVHIDRLRISQITLPKMDLYYGGYVLSTTGVTEFHDLYLRMSVPYNDAGELNTGQFIVHSMNIGRIDVNGLAGDMVMSGSLIHMSISSGSLHNVWLKNFVLDAPDPEGLGSQAGIGHFSEFRIQGAMENTASFDLNLNSPGGSVFDEQTESVNYSAITVDMVETSLQRVHLQHLVGSEGLIVMGGEPIGPDGQPPRGSNFVRIGSAELSTLAGQPITFHDDSSISAGLAINLELSQIEWYAAKGRIFSEGPVSLNNVTVDLVYGSSEEHPIILNSVLIGELSVQKLLFERGDEIYGIQNNVEETASDAGLEIYNIAMENVLLNQDYMPDSFDFSINDTPGARPRESRIDLFAQLAQNNTILSRLWIPEDGQVTMNYRQAGRLISLNAEDLFLNVFYEDASVEDEYISALVKFTGMDTGDIVFRDTGDEYVVSIGAGDGAGMDIETLLLDSVKFQSPELSVEMEGGVTFNEIDLRMEVTLPKNKPEDDVRPFSQMFISELYAERVDADDMVVEFEHQGEDTVADDGTVTAGKKTTGRIELGRDGAHAGIYELGLRGARPPENFSIEPVVIDIPEEERVEGGPTQRVDWARSIHGILSTGDIIAGGISARIVHDGRRYDIGMHNGDSAHPTHPSEWNIRDGNPHLPGVVMGGFEYNTDDESVMFRNVEVSGLHLHAREEGVTLDVRKISIPEEAYMYLNGDAVQRQIDAGQTPDLLNVIPSIVIEDAYFRVNDLSSLMSEPESDQQQDQQPLGVYGDEDNPGMLDTTIDGLRQLRRMASFYETALDGADGHIAISMQGLFLPFIDQHTIRADVHQGHVVYEEFIEGGSMGLFDMDLQANPRMLILSHADAPLIGWDLSLDEYRRARDHGEVPLKKMMQPRVHASIIGGAALWDWWNDGDAIEEDEPANKDYFEITDIDVQLSSNHPTNMQPITYTNEDGTMSAAGIFDQNMFNNLRVTGDLQTIENSDNRIWRSYGAFDLSRPGEIQYSMDDLNLDAFGLQMRESRGDVGSSITTGPITLSGLKDGRLTFDGYTPVMLEGHLLSGEINNLRWMPEPSEGDE